MIDPRKTDVSKTLGQLLGGHARTGVAGALAGGMLASKAGRKLGKKALKLGGLAAVGGVAWLAYDRYRRGDAGGAPLLELVESARRAGFLPPPADAQGEQELGLVLIRAMIAAARADGKLDGRESDAIHREIDELELGPDEKELLRAELSKPVDVDALVAAATTPEIAAEIYTASLLAIELDTPAERAWLAMLAARLGLPDALRDEIDRRVADSDATALATPA
jgi:uncharacterized membrane protein YebE (DUF533 family)